MMSRRYVGIAGLLLLPVFLLYGCYSFSGASISADMKTCTILLFQSRAPLAPPSLSSQLTEALKQKVVNQTALGLTNNGGDAIFEGTVTVFTVQPVAVTGGGTPKLTPTGSTPCG